MTLGLVAIGVLVAELFVVRDRMWLLGLSRAVGARRSDLVKLIVLDVFGIIFVGVVFAILLSIGLSPVFEAFGQSAFQSSLVLFRLDLLPLLLTFLVTSVTLGAFHPALMVLRLDPADTVERR
jgi:ABC-type antimicrobial peptide transport system permease subunit